MFTYVPSGLADDAALVVVLHGCGQTAAGYDYGAGWSTLADRYGFALLLPEQQRTNNAQRCFNWFSPADTERDSGEPASIKAMVDRMVRDHGIDPRRVFITGLSAGGAMTSAMLACYPEVFAAGAIIAGLPYGAAENVQQALQSMSQSPSRPAQEWGDLVHTRRLATTGQVAAHLDLVRLRRHGGDLFQRPRDPQAMDRGARTTAGAVETDRGRRLSARGVAQRRRRRSDRILQYHEHGARHAACDRRRRVRVRRARTVPARGWNLLLVSHRPVFRADRGGRASGCAADKWHRHRQEAAWSKRGAA